MNDLEKIIRNSEYNEKVPSGHKERFKQKHKKRFGINLIKPVLLAASVAAALVFVFTLNPYIEKKQNFVFQPEINLKLEKASDYYELQINSQLTELESLQCEISDSQKDGIMEDIMELNQSCEELETELKDNPDNEHIIHAIIANYETKTEILKLVISELKRTCV